MIDWKKYGWHIGFIVLFIILCFYFFKPYLIDHRPIEQSDITHHKGMSHEIVEHRAKYHEEPLWTNAMFGGMPAYQISTLYQGNYTLVVTNIFRAIVPHPVTFLLICMVGFYLLLLTLRLSPVMSAAGAIAFAFSSYFLILVPAGHNSKALAIAYMAPVLAGILMTFRGKLWLGAGLTALALALELETNHLQITYYLIFITLFIGASEIIRLLGEGKRDYLVKSLGVLVLAAVIGLLPNLTGVLLTKEYSKYSMRGGSVLTITPEGKKIADEAKNPGLDFDYAMAWSYGVGETMTLLIPDFNGGSSMPLLAYDEKALDAADAQNRDYIGSRIDAYFGDQTFTSGPVYVGAIVCFLFVLGIFIIRDRIKWWLLGITVLSIMMAWGSNLAPFNSFLFHYIPLYNMFRAPSMALVIAEVTMPLMALLAVRELILSREKIRDHQMKVYYGVSAFVLLVCFLVWAMPDSFVSATTPLTDAKAVRRIEGDLRQQKAQELIQKGVPQQLVGAEMQKPEMQAQIRSDASSFYNRIAGDVIAVRLKLVSDDAIRSFLFILAAAALIFAFVRFGFNPNVAGAGLLLLVMLDQIPVAHRYVNDEKYSSIYAEKPVKKNAPEEPQELTPADQAILADTDPEYRVLNATAGLTDDANTSYYHKSLGGYHPAKFRRYQDLIEFYLEDQRIAVSQLVNSSMGNDSIIQAGLANMGPLNMLNTRYIIFNPDYPQGVIRNRQALGNAWFVDEVKQVNNSDEEIIELGKVSLGQTALIDKEYQGVSMASQKSLKKDPAASIKLTSYKANELKYESKNSAEGIAVFSEIFYDKGWNAYVDGKLVPHFRADYLLRGLKVPAGSHEIVFRFEPAMYSTGKTLAMIGSLLVFGLLGFGIWKEWKEKQANAASGKKA